MTSVTIKNLDLNFGAVKVLKDLNLDIDEGEFLVLLGASGCGKSTLLNCIAGLLDVSGGQIFINDKNVTWAEPSERGIGMVFQSYALYPQMTVAGNLSFGLKNAKVPKAEIEKRLARAAEILQIEPLMKRKPGALSGGQRQRVAIGRALVRDVDVFLFDEPLSNLDAKLRADLRVEIKRLHQQLENTMVYVTHDQIEAMTLADRIVVLSAGYLEQVGAPIELYERPANLFVAQFIGSPAMNIVSANVQSAGTSTKVKLPGGGTTTVPIKSDKALEGQGVKLGFRPEDMAVDGGKSPLVEGTITLVESLGEVTNLYVEVEGAADPVVAKLPGTLDAKRGDRIGLTAKNDKMHLFNEAGQSLLYL